MNATMFHRDLAYHDYEGPSLYLDERDRLLASLGGKRTMILRNHGLLAVGDTVPAAFLRLYRLECACQIQIDAGAPAGFTEISHNVAARSGADTAAFSTNNDGFGQLEFNALLRKLDQRLAARAYAQ